MSDILAKLRAVHGARERVKVHVEEYGIDLYFPPLTLEARERCRRGINPKDEVALYVNSIVQLAQNEDGTPAFPNTPEVKAELHRMEASVLMWIVQASGGQKVPEAALAEIAEVDPDTVRAALVAAFADAPELAASAEAMTDARIGGLLREIAAEHHGATPVKNG